MEVASRAPDIWFTADHHFDHANIIKYCNRPFASVEEMNETMVANWNRVVKPEDLVYHLGDFALTCWQRAQNFCERLNGTKILVMGNHDRHSAQYYLRCGFEEVHKRNKGMELFLPSEFKELTYVVATHRPLPFEHIIETDIDINLHGHVHSREIHSGSAIDVGVDAWDFTPVSYAVLYDLYRRLK